jgi:site-specific DNA-methyltransferase (adenine-specific)
MAYEIEFNKEAHFPVNDRFHLSNELITCKDLTGTQIKLIAYILRKAVSFPEESFYLKSFCLATGVKRTAAENSIGQLLQMNILEKKDEIYLIDYTALYDLIASPVRRIKPVAEISIVNAENTIESVKSNTDAKNSTGSCKSISIAENSIVTSFKKKEGIELNKIYNEDCLLTLDRMKDNLLDLTITSPPYNLELDYDIYKDNKEYKDYINWLRTVFEKVYHKTKIGGRIAINISDKKNGGIPVHSDIIQMMKFIGWLPMTTIIWDKNTVTNRNSWGSFSSPSSPSFPTPFEYILLFAKGSVKLQTTGETDITKDEFVKWSLAKWSIATEKNSSHPAPFPLDLPVRLIKMLSYKDAVVYDCFNGSGTTSLACKLLDRNFIGSEISPAYVEDSLKRLSEIQIGAVNF